MPRNALYVCVQGSGSHGWSRKGASSRILLLNLAKRQLHFNCHVLVAWSRSTRLFASQPLVKVGQPRASIPCIVCLRRKRLDGLTWLKRSGPCQLVLRQRLILASHLAWGWPSTFYGQSLWICVVGDRWSSRPNSISLWDPQILNKLCRWIGQSDAHWHWIWTGH